MLAEALIYRREQLNLSIAELVQLSGVHIDEYTLLENLVTHKMSIPTFEKLDAVMHLGEEFKKEYVTPYLRFGDVLRQKRNEKGLSLSQLSKISGVGRTYIWGLEVEDRVRMSASIFNKLAIALEIEDIENFEPFLVKSSAAKIKFVNDGFFGKLVLEKRSSQYLSQRDVAMMANIDFSLVSKIEVGSRVTMTTKNAIKLMNALKFTEEEKGRYLIKR